jgi:hypothetical protein
MLLQLRAVYLKVQGIATLHIHQGDQCTAWFLCAQEHRHTTRDAMLTAQPAWQEWGQDRTAGNN